MAKINFDEEEAERIQIIELSTDGCSRCQDHDICCDACGKPLQEEGYCDMSGSHACLRCFGKRYNVEEEK